MITFSQLGSYGRLGNQIFQYALLKSVNIKTGYDIVLPHNLYNRTYHGQKCLLNNFKLPSCNYGKISFEHMFTEKQNRLYDEEVYTIKDNTNFSGFFQNPNYYTNIREELINEFEMIDPIQEKINNYLNSKGTTVSLHVRRGDISDGTNPIDTSWSNDFSIGSVQYEYYKKSIDSIPENSTILLFTGGSRKNTTDDDIKWCKEHFKDERIVFVDGFNDIETFGLMKSCDYNITSFASTFSWWASFLNKNNNVIAPKKYYPSENIEPSTIYPKNWKLL